MAVEISIDGSKINLTRSLWIGPIWLLAASSNVSGRAIHISPTNQAQVLVDTDDGAKHYVLIDPATAELTIGPAYEAPET